MYLIGGVIIFLIILLVCFSNSTEKGVGVILIFAGILLLTSFTVVGLLLIFMGGCIFLGG